MYAVDRRVSGRTVIPLPMSLIKILFDTVIEIIHIISSKAEFTAGPELD